MNSEALTRADRIDHQLAKAGWAVSSKQVIEELWLQGFKTVGGRHSRFGDEFVDYALMDTRRAANRHCGS